ncbi:MAG: ribosome hibernation-promoting factor, HPF/YfiA family [Candidatus Saccharibacteria bacterium]
MIKQLDITGVHMQVGEDLHKYVTKKIGRLDRYIPRAGRESVYVQVKLKESKPRGKKECICEVIMQLPHEKLTVTESTINTFAAIDIAETKLHHQLAKYKSLHANPRLHRRLLIRLKHRPA